MNELLPYQLTNDIAPKPEHPSNPAFKPDSDQSILRQKIWRYLQDRPEQEIPLADIVKAVGEKYSKVYNAAKVLCLKHLATRREEARWRLKAVKLEPGSPFQKLPSNVIFDEKGIPKQKIPIKPIIKLKFVEPFSSSKGPDDQKKRVLW